jgi:hypothetical protein
LTLRLRSQRAEPPRARLPPATVEPYALFDVGPLEAVESGAGGGTAVGSGMRLLSGESRVVAAAEGSAVAGVVAVAGAGSDRAADRARWLAASWLRRWQFDAVGVDEQVEGGDGRHDG